MNINKNSYLYLKNICRQYYYYSLIFWIIYKNTTIVNNSNNNMNYNSNYYYCCYFLILFLHNMNNGHILDCILYTCQSSVVCVMCPHLMFPYLVCFLSLFNVIISSFMSSRVCLIIYDLPVYISSCLFSLMWSGLLVIPGVSCLWVLPCPVMSCLDVLLNIIIWVYILVCVFLFLPRVCTVTILYNS